MIQQVAEVTNFNFDEIFRMPAADFFAYVRYINEKRRREYVQMKKDEARLRAMRKGR